MNGLGWGKRHAGPDRRRAAGGRILGSVLSLLALAILAMPAPAGAAPPPPTAEEVQPLLGGWQLDSDRSQDFRSVLRDSHAGRPRDGGFSGSGGGGGRPGGGPPGTGNSGFQPPTEAPDMTKLAGRMEAPLELRIAFAEGKFTIAAEPEASDPLLQAPPFSIVPNAKKIKRERPDGAPVKSWATWKGGELTIFESPARGPERSELYHVATGIDGKPELIVVVSLEAFGPLPPISVRWVYRRAEAP